MSHEWPLLRRLFGLSQSEGIRLSEKKCEDWSLLLQLDSDEKALTMWGDAGRLFYWILQKDLTVKDFSNSWMTCQCG